MPDDSAPIGGGSSRKVENELTVLLEHLARQNLGEQVSRVGDARRVVDGHNTCTSEFAHLEQNRRCIKGPFSLSLSSLLSLSLYLHLSPSLSSLALRCSAQPNFASHSWLVAAPLPHTLAVGSHVLGVRQPLQVAEPAVERITVDMVNVDV